MTTTSFARRRRRPLHAVLLVVLLVAPLVAPLVAGCSGGLTPQEPFVSSSLDLNRGRPHRAVVDDALAGVVDSVIALAKQRELTLVKQDAVSATRSELAFRSKPVDRRIFRGTANLTLAYYSRFFVTVEQTGARSTVTAIGVPVLGGEMACPATATTTLRCRAPLLNRSGEQGLVAAVKEQWGYDVSGALEAETLQGLIAELAGARPASGGSGAGTARATRLIVAIFDVEDQAGQLAAATLGQLTEYLAAKVTQVAGFQVVPREQLRTQLAVEKRKSYKACYEQRCQIELGRAVAAQKSLATKLLRVGKQCAMTALLYDLKSETTERAASVTTSCSAEALLAGVEQLARQLAAAGQR